MKLFKSVVVVCCYFLIREGSCSSVEIKDNTQLGRKITSIREMFMILNEKEKPQYHPGIPLDKEVQMNTFVSNTEPIYSTTKIVGMNGEEEKDYGTGFLVIDRSKPFDGIYRPSNLSVSKKYADARTFPKIFLITNEHVLNGKPYKETVSYCCCLKREVDQPLNEKFYKFTFHLVKAKDTNDDGRTQRIGEFKSVYVKVPLSYLVVISPQDKMLDLVAINVSPIFLAIQNYIGQHDELSGFEPFYSAFDSICGFGDIPEVGTEIETFGYPKGSIGGDFLPNNAKGLVSNVSDKCVESSGKKCISNACCELDFPGGVSGSPIFYVDNGSITSQKKLVGIAFASHPETNRLTHLIKTGHIKDLLANIYH